MKTSRTLIVFLLITIHYNPAEASGPNPPLTILHAQQVVPAKFPSGENGWSIFLNKNLKWPPETQESYGRVVAAFFVAKDGRLTNIRIIKHLSREQDSVVLNLLKISLKWIPARRNGVIIRSERTIPINFELVDQ